MLPVTCSFKKDYLRKDYRFFRVDGTSPCRIDGYDNNTKPGFMLGIKSKNKKIYLLYVEIKREGCESNYQVEDNFTKLLKSIKSSLNPQIRQGIADPVSYGLLVEGVKASLYQMKLVEEGRKNLTT